MPALRGRSWVAIHIDACFACRFRLPIGIGDSLVRGIDRVDLTILQSSDRTCDDSCRQQVLLTADVEMGVRLRWMHMERAIPILPTTDLAAAKAFYVDGLGFRVTFEASADGRTGLLGLQRGTIELTLDCPMDGHGRNACVSLHVADADAYYREWSAKVTPLRPPKNEEWGARTFDLLDPSGNTLFVIGPIR